MSGKTARRRRKTVGKKAVCKVEGCEKRAYVVHAGWCEGHYRDSYREWVSQFHIVDASLIMDIAHCGRK